VDDDEVQFIQSLVAAGASMTKGNRAAFAEVHKDDIRIPAADSLSYPCC